MRALILSVLLLGGCNNIVPIGEEEPSNAAAVTNATARDIAPGARAVRIGEPGAAFAACATRGRIAAVGPAGAPLHAAPFAEAEAIGTVPAGAPLFMCSRSIDQRWVGVVVPPAEDAGAGCGVTEPVASPRDYDGPCRSGWIAFAQVRVGTGG